MELDKNFQDEHKQVFQTPGGKNYSQLDNIMSRYLHKKIIVTKFFNEIVVRS